MPLRLAVSHTLAPMATRVPDGIAGQFAALVVEAVREVPAVVVSEGWNCFSSTYRQVTCPVACRAIVAVSLDTVPVEPDVASAEHVRLSNTYPVGSAPSVTL